MTERGTFLACALVGALGGLAAGMLGIGGGLLVVPLLGAWLHVPLKRAIGTSLVVVLVTSIVSVATIALDAPGDLRWGAAAVLAAGAVLGAVVGARIVAATPPRALGILLGVLLVVSAAKMLGVFELLGALPRLESELPAVASAAGHLLAGLLAGVLSAMFGIGGGILAVPALAFLHPAWTFQACRATSLVMIVPTAVLAGTLHRKLDNVDARIARALAPSAAAGAVAGVLVANRAPERPLEWIFAAVLLLSALKLARTPR